MAILGLGTMSIPEELKNFFAIGIFTVLLCCYFYEAESVSFFKVVLFFCGIIYALYASVRKYNIEKEKDVEFIQRLTKDLLSSTDRIKILKEYVKRLNYQHDNVNTSASVSSEELCRRCDLKADYKRALKIVQTMLEKEIKKNKH